MKKPKENRTRPHQLLIRLTASEMAAIRKAAKAADQPVAWWVRRVLMGSVGK